MAKATKKKRSSRPKSARGHAANKAGVRSGTERFRPRARIVRTLGRELITNEYVAVQELVKNSYDADAKLVRVVLLDPLRGDGSSMVVQDDGNGMTLDILRNSWMEPATISKRVETRSRRGRAVTGEKGIGRFAAARIASVLELDSVSLTGKKRVRAVFDWSAFDNPDMYLDQIRCDWFEEPAPDSQPGTELRLRGLHDDWEENDGKRIVRLRDELSRLLSPILKTDFAIELVLPARFSHFGGRVTPPASLGRPRYTLAGNVLADGTIDALYQNLEQDPVPLVEAHKDGERKPRILPVEGTSLRCGGFGFEFRVWDRRQEDLDSVAHAVGTTVQDVRRDLDAASGVSIYRDGFRIMLEAQSDWLGLDKRRVQNPTMRISNNQIVGVVTISRQANPALVDQSNRQGIVDSPASADLRKAVIEVLSKLETQRSLARQPGESAAVQKGLFAGFDLKPLREFVSAHYPADRKLVAMVEDVEARVGRSAGEVKVVLTRYRRLATLGQLIDGILHEGRTPIAAISNEVVLANRDIQRARRGGATMSVLANLLTPRLGLVEAQTVVLSELFSRIAPFGGRKRNAKQVVSIEKVLANTVKLAQTEIRELGVQVKIPETETLFPANDADMQGVFYNLVENALYWLSRVPEGRRSIAFEVTSQAGEVHVLVSDSGPGIDEAIRESIFSPYFSTRPDGVGLGLALAGELAKEYDGELELLGEGPLDGATFRVILRRPKEESSGVQ